MKRGIRLFAVLLSCAACLLADISFTETTNLTGGSMAGAMKFVGKMGGGGLNNKQTYVYLSGDVMARIDERSATITDLGARTITNVDFKREEYSVITFEQMQQAIAQMQEQARERMEKSRKKNADQPTMEVDFNVEVKDPGRTARISNFDAREMILLITAEFKDQQQGTSGAMNMASNLWLAKVPGYEEYTNFARRLAEAIDWTPAGSMFEGMQEGFQMGDSMAKLQEQAAKLEGVMVKQIMRLGGSEDGLENLTQEDQEKVAAAQENSGMGLKKGLGSALGGFGGFGRKNDRDEEPQPAANGAPTAAQAGVLMEITTLYSDFSNSAVDAAKLRPYTGFKEVEHEMVKQLRKNK